MHLLKKPLVQFQQFREKSKRYLKLCQDEITLNNFVVTQRFAVISFLLMLLHFVSMVTMVEGVWKIIVMAVLLVLTGGVAFAAWRYEKKPRHSTRVLQLLMLLLELFVIGYMLFISVFTMPTRQAIYYPGVFMLLPVLFIRSIERTLADLTGITAAYMVLLNYKVEAVAMTDRAVALVCLLMGGVMTLLVFDLRLREYAVRSQLRALVTIDGLTGLNNKISAERLCAAYLSEEGAQESCSLMMIDVDDFKQVNDVAGHQAGDMVLTAMGECLRSLFRGNDILGRVGGDEFLVLMKGTADTSLLMDKASQLEQRVNCITPGKGLFVSCTIGIAMRESSDAIDFPKLFSVADQAMYEAKRAGKNRVGLRSASGSDTSVLRRVMVVADDDPIGRIVIRTSFEDEFEIVEAQNGQEALEALHRLGCRVAVLLLDIGMPVLNGYEVLRLMTADPHLKEIPVIVITADRENELHALELGATDMLHKPIDPQILRHRVSNALRKESK